MQFEFSEIVAEAIEKLQEDINNEATPEGQIPYLKDQLVKLQQVKKGLDVAVRGNPLAHQLKRANEEEKSYNPHATPADKLVAYGLKGTARNALSMFVNRDQKQPASEQEPSIASREESSTSSLGKTP